jgi:hypothetical protein
MRNITLTIEDEVLVAARRYASGRDTSVNALVREYLTLIAQREDRAAAARQRIRELSACSKARLGDKSWTRDELHDG